MWMISHRSVVVAISVFALAAAAAHATPSVEYSAGHCDIGVAYEDGELELHYHFGAGAELNGVVQGVESEYAPSDVFVRVPDSQYLSRPAGTQWDFLGTSAGSDFWYLPWTPVADVPYFGVAAEELSTSDWVGNISYTVTAVNMPAGAQFSIWDADVFGSPNVQVATSDGLPDTLAVLVGSHAHYNWGFTAEGVYEMQLTASGTHAVDGPVSDSETFWFAVGDATLVPEPASLALLGLGMAFAAIKRRRRAS